MSYSTKVTGRSVTGKCTKGELYEGDLLVATFTKPALSGWNYWDVKIKFPSERARNRFSSYCNCLSMSETLEALTGAQ